MKSTTRRRIGATLAAGAAGIALTLGSVSAASAAPAVTAAPAQSVSAGVQTTFGGGGSSSHGAIGSIIKWKIDFIKCVVLHKCETTPPPTTGS